MFAHEKETSVARRIAIAEIDRAVAGRFRHGPSRGIHFRQGAGQPLDCQCRFVPLVHALNLIDWVVPAFADGQLAGLGADCAHQFAPLRFQRGLETDQLAPRHHVAP